MKAMSEKISDYSDPKKYAKYYYENKCDIDFNNKKAIRKMCEQYIEVKSYKFMCFRGYFGRYRTITWGAQVGIGTF